MAAILAALAAGVLVVFGTAASDDGDTYQVRAIFDSGGFMVPGEEVRIAGARVGTVAEVDVTRPGEQVHSDGSDEPGKAVLVLEIEDAAFQSFRTDAECIIRPQSLLGERYVECKPTQPRAPGVAPRPELAPIAEGEPGEGQALLPLERTHKAIDLDLVNNIMREPYPDRFRLILNDLGAGLAARGDDLEAVIRRANPALERTDEVLAILARQNRQLSTLARDGDQVLQPLAAQRERIGGFINSASETAAATAERRADLEGGLRRLPGFLRELDLTMVELDSFSERATPVVSDLGDAAPDLTRVSVALGPFSEAGTKALVSLGRAAEQAGPDLQASRPVLADVKRLAQRSLDPAKTLSRLLRSLEDRNAFTYVAQLIYNTSGAINAFDSYGHIIRALFPLNNCVDYVFDVSELACDADFTANEDPVGPNRAAAKERQGPPTLAERRSAALHQELLEQLGPGVPSEPLEPLDPIEPSDPLDPPGPDDAPEGDGDGPGLERTPPGGEPGARSAPNMAGARILLDYLFGEPGGSGAKGARR